MPDWNRPLTEEEARLVQRFFDTAHRLYDGVETPHRSCGIAIAETFGRPTPTYQSLRRGGLNGMGPCGVRMAGQLVLGELLGDPDPTGPATDALKDAMADYWARLPERLQTLSCNDLVADQGDFHGSRRHRHCTDLAAENAALLAEVLVRHGHHDLLR